MKKYALLLLLGISINGFSQTNKADTARYEIQVATVSGDDHESPYGTTKDYNPKDFTKTQLIDLNCLVGDYWSRKPIVSTLLKNDSEEESSDGLFAFYKFYNDSTFKSESGYLSRLTKEQGFEGKYEFFDEYKIIFFNITNSLNQSIYENDVQNQIPTGVRMLEVTDSTVTFITRRFGADLENKTITMYRYPGCVATQRWEWQDAQGGKYSMYLTDNGSFEYWANQSVKVEGIDEYLFQGQYHLHNNVLYLDIQKIIAGYKDQTRETQVMTFDKKQHTYVRVDLDKKLINESDLGAIHKAKIVDKYWKYKDCQYQTIAPIKQTADTEWLKITKIEKAD